MNNNSPVPGPQPLALDWYALRVRTRSELMIAAALENRGYHPFLPTYEERRRWSDRIKRTKLALFPGYVFCRLDSCNRVGIVSTPGVLEVVGFGGKPEPVPEPEIEAIRLLVESELPARPSPFIREGDRVVITYGPLRGAEGIIAGFGKNRHLILSITMLQRSVSVAMDDSWVQPLN